MNPEEPKYNVWLPVDPERPPEGRYAVLYASGNVSDPHCGDPDADWWYGLCRHSQNPATHVCIEKPAEWTPPPVPDFRQEAIEELRGKLSLLILSYNCDYFGSSEDGADIVFRIVDTNCKKPVTK